MNANDLHSSLAAPAVSRTTFFAELLASPGPYAYSEPANDALTIESTDNFPSSTAQPINFSASGFAA